jgi:hypothetical protein
MQEATGRVPEPPAWQHDRGIVICRGGSRSFPSLFVTIACIRKIGGTLPIQVWFLGDRGESDLRMLRVLEPFNVGWICWIVGLTPMQKAATAIRLLWRRMPVGI